MIKHHTLIRLCRTRELLESALDTTLRIGEVADLAGLSKYYFIRQFTAVFGATPHQYRLRARLEHAKQLLAAGDLSVTETCVAVGFSSLGTFSDLFSRRIGVSPSHYRREVRTLCSLAGRWQPVLMPSCFALMGGSAGIAIFEKHSQAARAKLTSGILTPGRS